MEDTFGTSAFIDTLCLRPPRLLAFGKGIHSMRRHIEEFELGDKPVIAVSLKSEPYAPRAIVEKDDYSFLQRLGLSCTWTINNGYVQAPCKKVKGHSLYVARVLLDAMPGQTMRYRDKNPLNLTRSNLLLVEAHKATRRDRLELLKTKEIQ